MDPLNQREIARLEAIIAGESAVQRRRAELILLADQGLRPVEIAELVNLSQRRVYHWLREFRLQRMGIFRELPPIPPHPHTATATPLPPITPAELAAQHNVDIEHGRRVGEAATAIFDITADTHQLADSYRPLLETAALLYPLKPRLIKAQPLAGYTEEEQAILAAVVSPRRKKASPGLKTPTVQQDALALAAILQIAIPLGNADLELVISGWQQLEIHARGKAKKLRRAQKAGQLWADLFGQKVVIISNPTRRELAARLLQVPAVTPDTRFDQALRAVLIFYLEQIQLVEAGMKKTEAADETIALQHAIRGARHIFRTMGEQFDVTEVASIPRQLRWLSKSGRSLRQWNALTAQLESYLVSAGGQTAGLEAMLQEWSIQGNVARDELLRTLDSKRYHEFAGAAQKFIQTENAGIFGKTAARRQLRHVLPSIIWEQYQQVRAFGDGLESPRGKLLHDLRRQARNLYHLLAHFQAVLGPAGDNSLQSLLTLEEYLTFCDDVELAIDTSRDYLKAGKKKKPVAGVEKFIAAKRAEREDLLARLPGVWEPIASLQFRRDLGQAVAEL